MFHPDWDEGFESCSFWADSFDRMGWAFPWYSTADTEFNFEFDMSFSPAELEANAATYNYRNAASVGNDDY